MPLIEEVPLSAPTRITPGWALVPDTQLITALQPGKRNRGSARDVGGRTGAGFTAKQQKAAEARLAKLEKENHQDTTVQIPAAAKSRERTKKMTGNVRRILMYQRNFGHYLADELALAQAGTGPVAGTTMPVQRTDKKGREAAAAGGSRRTSTQQLPMHPPPPPPAPVRSASSSTRKSAAVKRESSTSLTTAVAPTPTLQQPSEPALDPLLKNLDLPKLPSARVMAMLVAEPPLSYTAAEARPLDPADTKPRRHFCGNCGYWGKVRCRACGAGRTCGLLECYKAHREVCEGLLR